jgi:hypothetical protein
MLLLLLLLLLLPLLWCRHRGDGFLNVQQHPGSPERHEGTVRRLCHPLTRQPGGRQRNSAVRGAGRNPLPGVWFVDCLRVNGVLALNSERWVWTRCLNVYATTGSHACGTSLLQPLLNGTTNCTNCTLLLSAYQELSAAGVYGDGTGLAELCYTAYQWGGGNLNDS